MRVAPLLAFALLLAGCATAFPPSALEGVNRQVTVSELRRDPAAYVGQRVIVGGEILATRTRPGQTEIELLGRPLRFDDAPDRTDASEGRVLVHTGQFLDPAVFAEGRRITVIGRVTGAEERAIGDLPYRYPVIASEQLRLWSREVPAALYPYPYPGFPWWPYGYRNRPYWYGPPPYPYWWW
jgi:outer membrane lipoprotein